MTLLVIAFLSGVLTVLAPCVLPILPIILWASVEDEDNKYTPYIIIASLSISIFIFSLLLKASTILIDVPPTFWKSFSGGLIIGLWIITLFPNLWKTISTKLWFSDGSNKLLNKSSSKKGKMKYILMGFALGPVFSSCSPTYALILAIILPAGIIIGITSLIAYILWLAAILLAISVFGQKLIKNLKWASDPNGVFKKVLWVIFILIGLAIFTGYDKKVEAAILEAGFLNTTTFEQSIIDNLELDDVEPKKKLEIQEEIKTPKEWHMCEDGKCEDPEKSGFSFLNPKNLLWEKKERVVSETWYEAADLVWLQNWINSQGIESLDELKWEVVAVKFWTFSCINCINTLGKTEKLYQDYKDEGFTILGVHAPEFSYEKKIEEVQKAVDQYWLTFPVVQDNDFETWRAYNNRYWPAFYLIDKWGKVRYTHFWEWKYEEKEQAVQELLAENYVTEQKFLSEWLMTDTSKTSIDLNLVLNGWPGKDGIPAIDSPDFLSQDKAEKQMPYLLDNSQWIVLNFDEEARYYSYDVLVWHEIVNDEIWDKKVSVTFCPLCGSAIVYDRNVNGREVNFWVSGRLYNSNLLMYDDYDETLWSQSLWEAVVWGQLGTKLDLVKSHLMTYEEFQKAFPEGIVLSDNTWYSRSYWRIPYGDYDTSDNLYFPVENSWDDMFHSKTLFYIVNYKDDSVAFAWNDLREEWEATISVGDDVYTATFDEWLADVKRNWEILPWYYEMWFSWRSHNTLNKNIWNKK